MAFKKRLEKYLNDKNKIIFIEEIIKYTTSDGKTYYRLAIIDYKYSHSCEYSYSMPREYYSNIVTAYKTLKDCKEQDGDKSVSLHLQSVVTSESIYYKTGYFKETIHRIENHSWFGGYYLKGEKIYDTKQYLKSTQERLEEIKAKL